MDAARKTKGKGAVSALPDSEEDFKYDEVSLEDEWSLTEGEEDLEATLKAIQNRTEANSRAVRRPNTAARTHHPPTVVDFVRNFLFQKGMTETLNCFQTEMLQNGLVDAERVELVPDVYTENRRLEAELKHARRENEEFRLGASAAAETLVRLQKARDLYRLQHKRIAQEKNRLIEEMRKLKVQCDSYEPAVKRMNEKHQAVLKQLMLVALERDKALRQLNFLSDQRDSPLCRGEEGLVNGTSVKKTSRPRPPAAGQRRTRMQPVKPNAP
ncbi:sperm-associated antigen 16 protein [Mugil cephalus]|uniref:sperm-associated antigen 16 protein n=1 Tax=Mugil cephalus TaxID=48193 RepID=UPI001FB78FF9|nr:sperm-associated antigen 16 protein [Mugil cephalus]